MWYIVITSGRMVRSIMMVVMMVVVASHQSIQSTSSTTAQTKMAKGMGGCVGSRRSLCWILTVISATDRRLGRQSTKLNDNIICVVWRSLVNSYCICRENLFDVYVEEEEHLPKKPSTRVEIPFTAFRKFCGRTCRQG